MVRPSSRRRRDGAPASKGDGSAPGSGRSNWPARGARSSSGRTAVTRSSYRTGRWRTRRSPPARCSSARPGPGRRPVPGRELRTARRSARALLKAIARVGRRVEAVEGDLARTERADDLARQAQLFVVAAAASPRGADRLEAVDWSSGEARAVQMPIDPSRGAREQNRRPLQAGAANEGGGADRAGTTGGARSPRARCWRGCSTPWGIRGRPHRPRNTRWCGRPARFRAGHGGGHRTGGAWRTTAGRAPPVSHLRRRIRARPFSWAAAPPTTTP